jgi:hypothetical protein
MIQISALFVANERLLYLFMVLYEIVSYEICTHVVMNLQSKCHTTLRS